MNGSVQRETANVFKDRIIQEVKVKAIVQQLSERSVKQPNQWGVNESKMELRRNLTSSIAVRAITGNEISRFRCGGRV